MSAQVQVPVWVLAALVEDCRTYGLCGKYLDQAEDLLEAARPKKQGVEERGPLKIYIAEPSTQEVCHGADGKPCAFEEGDEVKCQGISRLRPCWEHPGIIWREVK